jgi:DnaK suppressor protein
MTPPVRELDAALQADLRQRLVEARTTLFRTVATTDEELATLEAHQPGAAIEDAPRDQAVAILSRLGDRDRHALEEVLLALTKLRRTTYGLCEGCREAVPVARLRAMPATRYCLACQTARETPG